MQGITARLKTVGFLEGHNHFAAVRIYVNLLGRLLGGHRGVRFTFQLFVRDSEGVGRCHDQSRSTGRVPSAAILFLQAPKKSMQKMAFSCGGHLRCGPLWDLWIPEVLTAAAILGTEGGARIYCAGPLTRQRQDPLRSFSITACANICSDITHHHEKLTRGPPNK